MKNEQQHFPIFFITVVNDPAFRRKTLLTPARPPLGVTESATDGVVFTTVTTSARKYGSYEPPDPAYSQKKKKKNAAYQTCTGRFFQDECHPRC